MRLAEKLLIAMSKVPWIEKRGDNQVSGYAYAQESDFLTAIRPILIEQKVMMTTSVTKVERLEDITTVWTEHRFIDTESDESITVQGVGQGQDRGDKGVYKAITGAVKYVLSKNFLVPTGDDPEKDDPGSLIKKKRAIEKATMGAYAVPEGYIGALLPLDEAGNAIPESVKESKKKEAHPPVEKEKFNDEKFKSWMTYMAKQKEAFGEKVYYETLEKYGKKHAEEINPEDQLLQNALYYEFKNLGPEGGYEQKLAEIWNQMK